VARELAGGLKVQTRNLLAPPPAAPQSMLRKSIVSLVDWLSWGRSPKYRDPQNGENRHSSSSAGVQVNDVTAMGISAFWACTRLKGSTIGALPIGVYRGKGAGLDKPADDTPLYAVLHDSPNADQTPTDYWEFAAISLMLRGNHYARKLRMGGRLVGLEPVRPDIMRVRRRPDGRIGYSWSWQGEHYDLTEEDVFHVRGFGGGPLGGLSTISYARESLGIAIAADRAAGSIFANEARPSGVLKFKEWIDKDKRNEAREDIEAQFCGAHNAGRPFILEGGAEWQQISLNADDAQLLQSRGWSVEEVCRWFGVPPFMIGHSEKTTSWGTGIEQMLLAFQKFTLNPYLRRIEQSIRKQLITPTERAQGLFAEFNLEGLLRGDSAGRANFYRAMTQCGIMTVNECRAKENLAPIAGGDVARVQSQNVPLTEAGNEIAAPPVAAA
jgi:HK97 family phage portal protein